VVRRGRQNASVIGVLVRLLARNRSVIDKRPLLFGGLLIRDIEHANVLGQKVEKLRVLILDRLVEFVFSIVQLLADGLARESVDGRVTTNLVPVRLEFHSADWGDWGGLQGR